MSSVIIQILVDVQENNFALADDCLELKEKNMFMIYDRLFTFWWLQLCTSNTETAGDLQIVTIHHFIFCFINMVVWLLLKIKMARTDLFWYPTNCRLAKQTPWKIKILLKYAFWRTQKARINVIIIPVILHTCIWINAKSFRLQWWSPIVY